MVDAHIQTPGRVGYVAKADRREGAARLAREQRRVALLSCDRGGLCPGGGLASCAVRDFFFFFSQGRRIGLSICSVGRSGDRTPEFGATKD